MSYGFDWLLS
eukprot:gene12795-biopygen3359